MEYSQEVRKLAETLRNSGLAASMMDALEKAKSMLDKKVEKETKEEPFEREMDTAQTTLGEVKKAEKRVVTDESAELKKEEVFVNKTDIEQKKEDSNQKKVDYSQEKKVDLSKIFDVNK